jgi:hypothetical protein
MLNRFNIVTIVTNLLHFEQSKVYSTDIKSIKLFISEWYLFCTLFALSLYILDTTNNFIRFAKLC